ncbi:MAG: TraU family protein [Nitrospiria bacterium]
MRRREGWNIGLFIVTLLLFTVVQEASACPGRIFNPVTDVDWTGVFPIKIGGVTIAGFGQEDTATVSRSPICFCADRPPPLNVVPGIPVSFWEPVYLIEVVQDPYCFPSLGGVDLSPTIQGFGSNSATEGHGEHHAFYQAHLYAYPIISLLGLVIDFGCLQGGGFDLGYITELDPLWNSPELAALLTPEAFLFANPGSIAVCAADCAAATAGFPLDPLFWCSGCWGGVYPLNGALSAGNASPQQASALVASRLLFKLHRQGFLWGTVGEAGMCSRYPMPIIRKSQYKLQLAYPKRGSVFPIGRSDLVWGIGASFPVAGEDFVYVIWRKRDCCVL